MPDPPSLSVAAGITVTLPACKPSALGGGVTVAVVAGGVRSIRTVTEAELDPPAVFVAVHVSTVPGVSAERATGSHPTVLARGPALVTVQLTMTGVWFQPAAFGAGETAGTTCGGGGSWAGAEHGTSNARATAMTAAVRHVMGSPRLRGGACL